MKLGKKLYFCIFILMISFTLYGCFNGRDFEIQELGDWLYQDNGENSCAIMGLSERGKKQDILVLPTILNGKKVDYIGYRIGKKIEGNIDLSQALCRRFYMNSNHITLLTEIIPPKKDLNVFVPNKDAIISSYIVQLFQGNPYFNIYMSKDYYEYNVKNNYNGSEFFEANIEYYIDSNDCFFVDNVENGKIEVIPPLPFKEGYTFDGWYMNDVLWDFNNNLVEDFFDDNCVLKLEAKWIEVSK